MSSPPGQTTVPISRSTLYWYPGQMLYLLPKRLGDGPPAPALGFVGLLFIRYTGADAPAIFLARV
jgi:hypothetical protein